MSHSKFFINECTSVTSSPVELGRRLSIDDLRKIDQWGKSEKFDCLPGWVARRLNLAAKLEKAVGLLETGEVGPQYLRNIILTECNGYTTIDNQGETSENN